MNRFAIALLAAPLMLGCMKKDYDDPINDLPSAKADGQSFDIYYGQLDFWCGDANGKQHNDFLGDCPDCKVGTLLEIGNGNIYAWCGGHWSTPENLQDHDASGQ